MEFLFWNIKNPDEKRSFLSNFKNKSRCLKQAADYREPRVAEKEKKYYGSRNEKFRVSN